MITLLKLHWEFLRKPSECLEKYIRNWPLSVGLLVYLFFVIASDLMNVESLRVRMDIMQDRFTVGHCCRRSFLCLLSGM